MSIFEGILFLITLALAGPLIAIYTAVTVLFFVPLIIGLITILSVRNSKAARRLSIFLICLGVLGSMGGIPYWYKQAASELAARQHFSYLCQKATIQLPSAPVAAEGLLWLEPSASRDSFLSKRDGDLAWASPGRGTYQKIQTKSSDSDSIFENVYESAAQPQGSTDKVVQTSTLPFIIRTKRITNEVDSKFGIDGIETTITDTKTQKTIARRVVFARVNAAWQSAKPQAVCPYDALDSAECGQNGCSTLPFVIKAVPPVLPADLSKIFDLYRGRGYREINCRDGLLTVGPGISLKDVEWWTSRDWKGGWDPINIRVRGTKDHLYCPDFFWSKAHTSSKIRFIDNGLEYSMADLHDTFLRGSESSPRTFADVF